MQSGIHVNGGTNIGPDGLSSPLLPAEAPHTVTLADVLEVLRYVHADLRYIHQAFQEVHKLREFVGAQGARYTRGVRVIEGLYARLEVLWEAFGKTSEQQRTLIENEFESLGLRLQYQKSDIETRFDALDLRLAKLETTMREDVGIASVEAGDAFDLVISNGQKASAALAAVASALDDAAKERREILNSVVGYVDGRLSQIEAHLARPWWKKLW